MNPEFPIPNSKDLFDLIPDAVVVSGGDGVIRAANVRAAGLFKCEVDDLVGRAQSELSLPTYPANADSVNWSVIALLRSSDGSVFAAWLQVVPMQPGDFQATVIRGLSSDGSITFDPEMSILETLSEGVLIADSDGRLTYINRSGRAMAGIADTEPQHLSLRDLIVESPESFGVAEGPEYFLDRVLISGDPRHNVEALLSTTRQYPLEVSVNATPLGQEHGRPTGIIVSFRDISGQRHAELQISIQKRVLDLIAEGRPLGETSAAIVEYLERVIPGTRAAIHQLDRETGSVTTIAAQNLPGYSALDNLDAIERSVAAICVSALDTGRPIINPKLEADATNDELARALVSEGFAAFWCYPVDSVASRFTAVVSLYREVAGTPDAGVQSLIDTASGLLRIALDRVQIEHELQNQSFVDDLTGLPNRILLLDRLDVALQRLVQSDHKVALLLLDIDRFEMINSSLGYQAGDQFLHEAARRLRDSLRADDLVSRFTGDTFGILLDYISSEADAINVVMRVQRAFARPLTVNGFDIYSSVSIGIAMANTPDASAETLVRYADIALSRARERGQGQFAIFSPSQDLSRVPKIELQSRLHRALAADALDLHFQPVVSLVDQSVAGWEALVRWNDSRFGSIDPDEFLPLAQQAGIMEEITSWVLDRAVSRVQHWQEQYGSSVFCAVNISPGEMSDPLLVEQVVAVLDRYSFEPSCLILEVTEQAIVAATGGSSRTLQRLRDSGVRIALDDFGTGYSSLSYLEQMAVDVIKIDRAFIRAARGGASRAPVAGAMVDLARRLGMISVAEGIETEEDERVARQLGCDLSQGYYYGRPQSATDVPPLPRTSPGPPFD